MTTMLKAAFAVAALAATTAAGAAPVTYALDPSHTYPSFEADHFGGLSVWRGKFRTSSGQVVYDKDAQKGDVSVTIDAASIDFGHDKMNEHAKSAEMFDVAKFPTATYTGTLATFKDGKPTEVHGTLTMHGVTKPVNLKINKFLCKVNPMMGKEVCGADAEGTLNRADFGVSYGQAYGFDMAVTLRIQVEGIKQ
jgi:polyisoprenoid-binding protein YceI